MTKEQDIRIFQLAKHFLLEEMAKHGLQTDTLDKYLTTGKSSTLAQVYKRLIESGANKERAANVIKSGTKGGVENMAELLFHFDIHQVLNHYGSDDQALLQAIISTFGLSGSINESKQGIWPQWAKNILSGARFLSKFKDHADFDRFVISFPQDDRARNALPLLLKEEIDGFGIALACDFLKESGYLFYGKPDVYLKVFFQHAGLTKTESDYEVMHAINRVADHNGVTAYAVDKIFWLIGSGKFYLDRDERTGETLVFKGREKRKERFLKEVGVHNKPN
ncbi:MAG: hypothetical protein IT262_18510 [Saprospiraceae bacterium]|nr:hypothetical protein [Saprospiraceae bacterium]